jgi:hypothetical protein
MVCEEPVVDSLYSEPPTDGYNRCPQLAQALSATRKVDYSGGRRLHTWAAEAGFEIVDVRAYQPHYVTGPHKGFWSWTMEAAGPSLVAVSVAAKKGASLAVEREPGVGLRSGRRWAQEWRGS